MIPVNYRAVSCCRVVLISSALMVAFHLLNSISYAWSGGSRDSCISILYGLARPLVYLSFQGLNPSIPTADCLILNIHPHKSASEHQHIDGLLFSLHVGETEQAGVCISNRNRRTILLSIIFFQVTLFVFLGSILFKLYFNKSMARCVVFSF